MLNACETEEIGKKLWTAGVRHVVCWRSDVEDSTAGHFAPDDVRHVLHIDVSHVLHIVGPAGSVAC